MSPVLLAVFTVMLSLGARLQAVELPPELPLWDKPPQDFVIRTDVKEQVRSNKPRPESPSASNRVFSSVSSPTYSIHRPQNPNGVGLVICPGGGFREVWIDREGHDLAIWLKQHNVTSLVLKYRTRLTGDKSLANTWQNYQRAVQADGREAIRILRQKAPELGLKPDRIGICGFSAGGHLAINCALNADPNLSEGQLSRMPDFAGLFYPGIPEGIGKVIESRTSPESSAPDICPLFIINARVDRLTPADRCVDFYGMLLKAGVEAELHVFSKGSHGFDLGSGRGKSAAIWPRSFVAWLSDSNIIRD
ncbi:MAG: alpha/beta hydrolase [Planctomycetota bacterium]|jgi:acetyl esterase/lipase